MSARVLNPVMMTEISRNLDGGGGGGGGGSGGGGGRAAPSRAALARVRRDLFGPVDHAAARALAERELRAQSLLDAERWGFDFHLEIPRANSRYEWELVTEHDLVPEPYALRGMPYLRKHAPGTPHKLPTPPPTQAIDAAASSTSSKTIAAATTTTIAMSLTTTSTSTTMTTTTTMMATAAAAAARIVEQMETTNATLTAERTPPQEHRVPEIGDARTPPASHVLNTSQAKRKRCAMEPTTPVLPPAARKQSAITGERFSFSYSLDSILDCGTCFARKLYARIFLARFRDPDSL